MCHSIGPPQPQIQNFIESLLSWQDEDVVFLHCLLYFCLLVWLQLCCPGHLQCLDALTSSPFCQDDSHGRGFLSSDEPPASHGRIGETKVY